MTGTRFGIALLALVMAAGMMLAFAPAEADAATIAEQLRDSRRDLARSRARLADAQTAYAEAVLAHQQRGLGILLKELEKAKRAVRRCKARVRVLLAKRAAAQGSGGWRSIIDRAAKKRGVSADGLYRLMMMESGGKARAVGAGRYFGLYQYSLTTWRADWNPWRGCSVYNGTAQIKASALAVKRGMGRSLWGNTYPVAF